MCRERSFQELNIRVRPTRFYSWLRSPKRIQGQRVVQCNLIAGIPSGFLSSWFFLGVREACRAVAPSDGHERSASFLLPPKSLASFVRFGQNSETAFGPQCPGKQQRALKSHLLLLRVRVMPRSSPKLLCRITSRSSGHSLRCAT